MSGDATRQVGVQHRVVVDQATKPRRLSAREPEVRRLGRIALGIQAAQRIEAAGDPARVTVEHVQAHVAGYPPAKPNREARVRIDQAPQRHRLATRESYVDRSIHDQALRISRFG